MAVTTYGVRLKSALEKICAVRKASTGPRKATNALSFWSPMKSLRSGGITLRTAWGMTT